MVPIALHSCLFICRSSSSSKTLSIDSVKKDLFHLWVGHTGSCYDPRSSDTGHKVWEHVTTLDLEMCVISLNEAS